MPVKKILSIMLVAAMLFSFAACNGDKDTLTTTLVNVTPPTEDTDTSDPEGDSTQKADQQTNTPSDAPTDRPTDDETDASSKLNNFVSNTS